MLKTISIIVHGKVQGVFYRKYTKQQALLLQLNGWVANQSDGTVKIIATGTTEQLASLQACCKKGPVQATITSLTVTEMPLHVFTSFTIEKDQ